MATGSIVPNQQRRPATSGFRRRLTIAFLLVAGIAAAAVGLGAYLLVKDFRTDDFVARSLLDAETNYLTLEERSDPLSETAFASIVKRFERRSADAVIVFTPEATYVSDPEISVGDIPTELLDPSANDQDVELAHAGVTIAGDPFLTVATPETPSGNKMYLFYSRRGLDVGLEQLAGIISRLWVAVVIGAALVGNAVARRTLRPVRRASMAARSLAEGLLDTRLPIEREDEFGAWAVSFNEMAEALQGKISELVAARDRERQFTSDVSHELRTPLTALVSSASMLEQQLGEMKGEIRWISERMIREARRLRTLVDELLEISRLHSGRETVSIGAVDLGLLVENIIATHDWKPVVHFDRQTVIVSTDKARAERIVVNLIGNAVEHGKENPRVAIGREGENAFVEVRDDGPGITPDDLPHIFERFYKADSARRGGSGLGLSIAAENARLLGARIDISTSQGDGATFTLRLPVDASSSGIDVAD